jgi:N-dimethylarginine dimethylaminohydrolase
LIPTYLMSYPRADWGLRGRQNFLSASAGAPPSPRGAMQDWLTVASAIVEAGGRVVVMPPNPDRNLTGLPYTAEAGEFYRDRTGSPCFLVSKMAAAHRLAEPAHTAAFVESLGWTARHPSAVWEAQGDAIRVSPFSVVHTYGVGPAARTTQAAYADVADKLSNRHLQLPYRADPWFHGNTFLAWFHKGDDHVLLVCTEALFEGGKEAIESFAPHAAIINIDAAASRAYATNALQVGDTVLSPSGLPEEIPAVWRVLGLDVRELALPTLFRRGGGAAVCMTSRLWGVSNDDIATEHTFTAQRDTLHELAATYPDHA